MLLKKENMKTKVLFEFQRFIFVLQNFKLQLRIKQGLYICDISIKVISNVESNATVNATQWSPSSYFPSLFRTKLS